MQFEEYGDDNAGEYYRHAAELGHGPAAVCLIMLLERRGGDTDHREIQSWYEQDGRDLRRTVQRVREER